MRKVMIAIAAFSTTTAAAQPTDLPWPISEGVVRYCKAKKQPEICKGVASQIIANSLQHEDADIQRCAETTLGNPETMHACLEAAMRSREEILMLTTTPPDGYNRDTMNRIASLCEKQFPKNAEASFKCLTAALAAIATVRP